MDDKKSQDKKMSKGRLEKQQEIFQNILNFAHNVLDNTEGNHNLYKEYYYKGNEHPILDVVRLIGKNTQTKYLTSLLYCEDETELQGLHSDLAFFDQTSFYLDGDKRLYHVKKEVKNTKEIRLNKDLILPCPWKRERLIDAISNIGEERRWGEWKQDFKNHFVELWLPLGIAWVNGGNHSIATGIFQGNGTVKPESTYDISEYYDYIYTDGRNYFSKKDNLVIAPVEDVDFAAIFEIGRLMIAKSITF
jgi:hypothetical protein